jgi:hypothetical protein
VPRIFQNLRLVAVVFEDSRLNLVLACPEVSPRVGVLDRVEGGIRLAITRDELRACLAAVLLMLYPDGPWDPADDSIVHRATVVAENWTEKSGEEGVA